VHPTTVKKATSASRLKKRRLTLKAYNASLSVQTSRVTHPDLQEFLTPWRLKIVFPSGVGSIPSAGKIFENKCLADYLPSKNCQELASCFRITNRSLTYSGKFTQQKPPGNLRILACSLLAQPAVKCNRGYVLIRTGESKPKNPRSIEVRKAHLPVIRIADIDPYRMALPIMNEFPDRTYFIADGIHLDNFE
jgi:hypothetical protein